MDYKPTTKTGVQTMPEIIKYSDNYKEACFYAIYEAGMPKTKKWLDIVPPDEDGRKPHLITLKEWARDNGWQERADGLNAQLSVKLDEGVIQKRADAIKQALEVATDVMKRGHQYIQENGFDTAASAVRAIGMGMENIIRYAGMAEMLLSVPTMSDRQLNKELARLLGKNENDEIIDAEGEDVTTEEQDADKLTDDNE